MTLLQIDFELVLRRPIETAVDFLARDQERFQSWQNDSHRFCPLTMSAAGTFVSNNWENNLSCPIGKAAVSASIFRTAATSTVSGLRHG